MAATDHLGVQFRRADEDEDKHADLDVKGQDESSEFGYSEYDMSDAQWNRGKHSDKSEVF